MLKLLLSLFVLLSLYACDNAQTKETTPLMTKLLPKEDLRVIKKGKVRNGQGLFQAMRSVSIGNHLALQLINSLRDEVEFSKLKVGDQLEATYGFDGKLVEFSFSQNPVEKHIVILEQKSGKWNYSFKEVPTVWEKRVLEGELRAGSTLEEDLLKYELERTAVNEVISVLLCKVNFRMNARKGDRFKVLLSERKYKNQVIETKILYTSYAGDRAGFHEAFFYEDEEKGSTYTAHYTEDGQALIRSGLRYPLSRLHVRSSFGWRRHPVTGRRSMHRGVDLRGRLGNPVHAVAAGKVVESSYNEFAGNKIAVKHRDGSTSYYYHLHNRRVNKGEWVRTHQVIGTVGSSGRVTGPHLHFGFREKNGRWINPLNKRMIATPKLSGERLANLKQQVYSTKGLLADFEIGKEARYVLANIPNRRPASFNFDLF